MACSKSPTPPPAPFVSACLKMSAFQQATSILLKWNTTADVSLTNFSISYINNNNTECFNSSEVFDGSGDTESHSFTNLEEGTGYTITIIAVFKDETLMETIETATLTTG